MGCRRSFGGWHTALGLGMTVCQRLCRHAWWCGCLQRRQRGCRGCSCCASASRGWRRGRRGGFGTCHGSQELHVTVARVGAGQMLSQEVYGKQTASRTGQGTHVQTRRYLVAEGQSLLLGVEVGLQAALWSLPTNTLTVSPFLHLRALSHRLACAAAAPRMLLHAFSAQARALHIHPSTTATGSL